MVREGRLIWQTKAAESNLLTPFVLFDSLFNKAEAPRSKNEYWDAIFSRLAPPMRIAENRFETALDREPATFQMKIIC
jgi:hypothetical protein